MCSENGRILLSSKSSPHRLDGERDVKTSSAPRVPSSVSDRLVSCVLGLGFPTLSTDKGERVGTGEATDFSGQRPGAVTVSILCIPRSLQNRNLGSSHLIGCDAAEFPHPCLAAKTETRRECGSKLHICQERCARQSGRPNAEHPRSPCPRPAPEASKANGPWHARECRAQPGRASALQSPPCVSRDDTRLS